MFRATIRAFCSVHPKRVCVVGSGPAGFYCTKYLVKDTQNTLVDIVERLPTPFGLVRAGVAPDHPEVKNVQNEFMEVARNPRVRFFGNLRVGVKVSVEDLLNIYDAVIIASGAEDDKSLGIKGENLKGVISAKGFVNWYNGHPDFVNYIHQVHLDTERVAIIGQGNVALDCARILAKGAQGLAETDITDTALNHLKSSQVRDIVIMGRRGPAQVSFSRKEMREMTEIDEFQCIVNQQELEMGLNPASLEELKMDRAQRRIYDLLVDISKQQLTKPKTINIRMLLSPKEILPDPENPDRVGALVVERSRLEGEPGKQIAISTGETSIIKCGLVLRSIGWKSIPYEGVPFNHRQSIISNVIGRVVNDDGSLVPRLYCSGWVKRGPVGIIGSNIVDAKQTVMCVIEDLDALPPKNMSSKPYESIKELLEDRGIFENVITWEEFEKINEYELEQGRLQRKTRQKITSIDKMIQIAKN